MTGPARTLAGVAVLAVLAAAGCGGGSESEPVPGADADRGKALIVHYGCGSCHVIGGVDTANGTVGPVLEGFADNRYIAGNLANTPENAARWIERPEEYEPGTIMPDLGVRAGEAADIVAYLLEQ